MTISQAVPQRSDSVPRNRLEAAQDGPGRSPGRDRPASSLILFTEQAGALLSLRPGDPLNLERRDDNPVIEVFYRNTGEHVGSLPAWLTCDPSLFSAKVADPEQGTIRIDMFPSLGCGCIVNHGGYTVYECPTHFAAPAAPRWDFEPYDYSELSGDPRREQEQVHREITS